VFLALGGFIVVRILRKRNRAAIAPTETSEEDW
jgi:hypothetical protein